VVHHRYLCKQNACHQKTAFKCLKKGYLQAAFRVQQYTSMQILHRIDNCIGKYLAIKNLNTMQKMHFPVQILHQYQKSLGNGSDKLEKAGRKTQPF
jgi:hypothetical protein